MKTILHIRLKQAYRILTEIGAGYVVILLILSIPLLGGIAQKLWMESIYIPMGVALFIMINTHLFRKDKAFLKLIIKKPYAIYCVEYALIVLPFIILLLARNAWLPIGVLLGACILIPFMGFTIELKSTRTRPLFSLPKYFNKAYDWIAGLRKNWFYLIVLYLLGLIFCQRTEVIPVVLFLMSLTTTSFYQDGEPSTFLESFHLKASAFINYKIKWHLITFWVLSAPLVLLWFIFNAQYWYIFLILFVVISIFPILAIVLKYYSYEPGIPLTSQNMTLGIMVAFLCFPFTQPVPLIMLPVYYKKAITNLKNYLHA